MGINQLQLPSTQAFTPDVSGTLAGIGETLRKAQADAARQQALSQLGQGGAADTQTLIRSGDPTLLQLGMTMQQRQQEAARQAQLDARQLGRDSVSDAHQKFMENIALRGANRADEDKHLVKEITDASGATSLVRINPRTGEAAPLNIAGGAGLASSTPAPNNPFSTGGKFNNDQGKAAGFTDRMLDADAVLRGTNGQPGMQDQGADWKQATISGLPLVPDAAKNWMHSKEYQQFDQAKRNLINAQLRRESGAAIGPSEFDSANKQYFPQPGDSDEVKQQKAANRRASVEAMGREAGPAYRPKSIYTADGRIVGLPKIGEMKSGYRFRGGDPSDESSWVKAQ